MKETSGPLAGIAVQASPDEPLAGSKRKPRGASPIAPSGTNSPSARERQRFLPASNSGQIAAARTGGEELWHEGAPIFTAKVIDSASFAHDGSAAVSAIEGSDDSDSTSRDASAEGGQRTAPMGTRGIWLVSSSGEKKRISSETMDAYAPSLSPDGSRIAFTARELDESGKPSPERLYVGSVSTGSFQSYGVESHWTDVSSIRAGEWLDALRVNVVTDREGPRVLQVAPDGNE